MGVSSSIFLVEAFVGVGSNVDPEKNILAVLPEIQAHLQVLDASRFFRNPALSPGDRKLPPFVNGILKIRTGLSPQDLKYGVLRHIEGKMGRRRSRDRYSPRILDLDLLVYGDLKVEEGEFTLPDPDISVQPFWAVPLSELMPDLCPPGASLPMREIVRTLDTRSFVFLESFTAEVRRTFRLPVP